MLPNTSARVWISGRKWVARLALRHGGKVEPQQDACHHADADQTAAFPLQFMFCLAPCGARYADRSAPTIS